MAPRVHEVIVVDGGSCDGTARLAEAAGARVIRDAGCGRARQVWTVSTLLTPCMRVSGAESRKPGGKGACGCARPVRQCGLSFHTERAPPGVRLCRGTGKQGRGRQVRHARGAPGLPSASIPTQMVLELYSMVGKPSLRPWCGR
eukprot:359971-Chlamydomonas_euryale.AAC.6